MIRKTEIFYTCFDCSIMLMFKKIYRNKNLHFSIVLIFLIKFTFGQDDFYERLSKAAIELTTRVVDYDASYYKIDYPNGDIPFDKGVCTDVIIRSYRKLGIDLQMEVHEDMLANFEKYPNFWGLTKPDMNIDHRRVPNLMVFFSRKGNTKPITHKTEDYSPGDIVCWDLGNGIQHIGIVVNAKSANGKRYQIVHNIGMGQVMEDRIFEFKIIGHYNYKKNIY